VYTPPSIKKSHQYLENENSEPQIQGYKVEIDVTNSNPCNSSEFSGFERYELNKVIKWVKSVSLKIYDFHFEIYGKEELLDVALVESIKQKGILTPLIVNKDNFVISGATRLKVALFLGIERVPVLYSSQETFKEDLVNFNIYRRKKYSVILKEYQILKDILNIKQGCRTDLSNGKKANELPDILGVSQATLQRLSAIDKLTKDLYSNEPEKICEVWKIVDSQKKGINTILEFLKNEKCKRLNNTGSPNHFDESKCRIYNSSSAIMEELNNDSVSLNFCSPPYFGAVRDYSIGQNQLGWESTPEQYVNNLCKHFEATKRVLKESGSLVVNIGDSIDPTTNLYSLVPQKFVLGMQGIGWVVQGVYIWLKRGFIPTFPNAKPTSAFEYIFHFTKTKQVVFNKDWMNNESDPIYNSIIFGKKDGFRTIKDIFDLRNLNDGIIESSLANNSKLRTKCIELGIEQTHRATFPLILPSIFINLLTNSGDLVIDSFNGTSSTGAASLVLNRDFVGYELNKQYIDISAIRLKLVKQIIKDQKVKSAA
jgi:site-specific DNA-methyltransferase (adenine-specific)